MSKAKIVLLSITYGAIAIIAFISISFLLENNILGKLILSISVIIMIYLFLKFNIIINKSSNEKTISKVFPLLALVFWIILIYSTEPYSLLFSNNTFILNALIISIFIGLSEELLFRGVLYNIFYYNKFIYLIVSGGVFGILHYTQGMIAIITVFFIGIVLGVARLTKTPLWILIILHTIMDISSFIMENYNFTYTFETKVLRIFGALSIAAYSIIIVSMYLDNKKVWKFDFEGEKLENKSLWHYIIS